ncbi:hypothetical protein [Paractinoplanes tereljensis]|uniref:hypothetical protein n=1 Tax=Paractinoplanes tereljensis TaxID=571912 RepID=UPI0019413337|nr:hypothetical protein [Actinoplanes tereljensis]
MALIGVLLGLASNDVKPEGSASTGVALIGVALTWALRGWAANDEKSVGSALTGVLLAGDP